MSTPTLIAVTLSAMVTTASAVITFTTDETNTLVGNFSFDVAGPGGGLGEGLTVASFVHFDIDPTDSTLNTFVTVDLDGLSSFRIYGEDDVFPTFRIAEELFDDSGVQPIMYVDRNGTFTSGVDFSTIAYNYSDVEYSGNIFSGSFSFTQIPEPSTACLGLGSALFFLRRRR